MSSCVKSKLESSANENTDDAFGSDPEEPEGGYAFAVPESLRIPHPGRLSTIYSPGYKRTLVFSTRSLFDPAKNENLADSRSALCNVIKGLVRLVPSFVTASVALISLGFTYNILPSVERIKFSKRFSGILLLVEFLYVLFMCISLPHNNHLVVNLLDSQVLIHTPKGALLPLLNKMNCKRGLLVNNLGSYLQVLKYLDHFVLSHLIHQK